MTCPHCQRQLPDGLIACFRCGKHLPEATLQTQLQPQPSPPKPTHNKPSKRIFLIVLMLVLLVCAGFTAWKFNWFGLNQPKPHKGIGDLDLILEMTRQPLSSSDLAAKYGMTPSEADLDWVQTHLWGSGGVLNVSEALVTDASNSSLIGAKNGKILSLITPEGQHHLCRYSLNGLTREETILAYEKAERLLIKYYGAQMMGNSSLYMPESANGVKQNFTHSDLYDVFTDYSTNCSAWSYWSVQDVQTFAMCLTQYNGERYLVFRIPQKF